MSCIADSRTAFGGGKKAISCFMKNNAQAGRGKVPDGSSDRRNHRYLFGSADGTYRAQPTLLAALD